MRLKPVSDVWAEVARVYAKNGFCPAQTRNVELNKKLAQRRYLDPANHCVRNAILGDKEQVFFWLHKAYSEKSGALEVIKIVKPLQPFRSDPRYIDLLKRMGLPGDGGFAFGYTPFA